MPYQELTRFLLLPKLKFVELRQFKNSRVSFVCETETCHAFCPHCGLETTKVHDKRVVSIKDAPHGGKQKVLKITKKRFRCVGLGCKKVFTENIDGISKRARMTERMQREIMYSCQNYVSLKSVRKSLKVGAKTIYERHYNQLELEWRKRRNDPWPKTIGIDEHSFIRNKKYGHREFATIIVDYNNNRVKELVPTRISGELQQSLRYIPGREKVKNVVCDLSKTYKSFAKDFFPNAKIIADHFHVVRLMNPHLNKARKEITGDKRGLKIRRLLLTNSRKLDYWTRFEIKKWLEDKPKLQQLYYAKETLHKLYRCKGMKWAKKVMNKLLDFLALSPFKELQTLRKTLKEWRQEILNYFENRITNGKTEGYNRVCKRLQRQACGYKNFNNYRLRVLYVCS